MNKVFALILAFLFSICSAYAFSFKSNSNAKPPKMVETKQEWEQQAQNIPLSDRELKPNTPPTTDKKNYFPDPKYVFEKYNYPPGGHEYNVQFVKKNLVEHPIIVADKDCNYVAYANYYYAPDMDQIYSDFFVEELDSKKNQTERILEYNHKQKERLPIIKAGLNYPYRHLFQGLSIVDWSADSSKILIKERIGSTLNGIYKTYLYIHFVDSRDTIKLVGLDETIKEYYYDSDDIQLVKYRYDIEPLGFSAKDDDIIILRLYVYDKQGKRLFLGTWGYDIDSEEAIFYSKTNPSFDISSNGVVLKRVLE